MKRELVSIDKNRTRLLLPTNSAPTILEFFLTDTEFMKQIAKEGNNRSNEE